MKQIENFTLFNIFIKSSRTFFNIMCFVQKTLFSAARNFVRKLIFISRKVYFCQFSYCLPIFWSSRIIIPPLNGHALTLLDQKYSELKSRTTNRNVISVVFDVKLNSQSIKRAEYRLPFCNMFAILKIVFSQFQPDLVRRPLN